MIPDFNKEGNLPPGIHQATIIEIEERFAGNIKRRKHFEHLNFLITDLRKIGCKTIYIDGSFVTNKILPNDMDICWESNGLDLIFAESIMPILWNFDNSRYEQQKKYHADIFPANCFESTTGLYFIDFFQCDKNTGNQKGIIKLEI